MTPIARRIPALFCLLLLATPAPAMAQSAAPPEPAASAVPQATAAPGDLAALGLDLIEQLCASGIDDEAGLAACLRGVGAILAGEEPGALPSPEPSAPASSDLMAQARDALDEALANARDIDVQAAVDDAIAAVQQIDPAAAIDEALANARDIDVQAAVDDAIAAARDTLEAVDLQKAIDQAIAAVDDVDLEAAITDVLAGAQAIDLQAAIDEALGNAAAAGARIDVEVMLEDSISRTREVVSSAQAWLGEHAEVICSGSSLSVGTAAAAAVVYLTGSPGLALAAFEQVSGFGRQVCAEASQ